MYYALNMQLTEALSQEAETEYLAVMPEILARLAMTHINGSNGLMELLPYRPDKPKDYPGQDLLDPLVTGYYDQDNRDGLDYAALIAEPGFNVVRDALGAREGSAETMHSAGEHLAAGGNVAIVTRHTNLVDIAYALKMGSDFLHYQGYRSRVQAIVVSEMLPRIGHNFPSLRDKGLPPIPSMTTLQLLCTHIYKSYPRTDSTKAEIEQLPNAELVWAAIGLHNRAMFTKLKEELDKGGVLLGLAPTGTTKVNPRASGGVELAPLNDRTVEIMSHPSLRILRMLTEFGGAAEFAYLYPGLLKIEGTESAQKAMDELAATNTRGVEDVSDAALLARFGGVALDKK